MENTEGHLSWVSWYVLLEVVLGGVALLLLVRKFWARYSHQEGGRNDTKETKDPFEHLIQTVNAHSIDLGDFFWEVKEENH
mgnify:CR=1 FL=1